MNEQENVVIEEQAETIDEQNITIEVEVVEPQNAIVVQQPKSISQLSVDDIHVSIDASKSMEQQAEDVVNAMTTAAAVQDESVRQTLVDKKAQELTARATAKVTEAEQQQISATTNKEMAQRERYEAVLQTFGIRVHLPKFLLIIMLWIFSPIYAVLNLVIGVPCGLIKIIIDGIDNIITTYQKKDDENKPQLKTTVVVLLIIGVIAAVLLTVLKIFGKI